MDPVETTELDSIAEVWQSHLVVSPTTLDESDNLSNTSDIVDTKDELRYLRHVSDLDHNEFWRQCSRWIAFEGGISLYHVLADQEKHWNITEVHQLGSWFQLSKAFFDTLRFGIKGTSYFTDSDGNLCMRTHFQSAFYAEKLVRAFNSQDSPWSSGVLKEWRVYQRRVYQRRCEHKQSIARLGLNPFYYQDVAVTRFRPCTLAHPPSSVYGRIKAMLNVFDKDDDGECKSLVKYSHQMIITKKLPSPDKSSPAKDPVYILDFDDDPGVPILADIDAMCLQMRVDSNKDNFFKEHFFDLCHVLSGDAYERMMWRERYHQLEAEAIKEYKASPSTRKAQQAASSSKSWEVVFGSKTEARCPYCWENTIRKSDYPSESVHRAHIMPAIWGDLNDKHWWNTIPTCSSCNQRQPKVRTSAANRASIVEADERGDDIRREHMLIALHLDGKHTRVRSIAFEFFKYMLRQPSCPITIIGRSSLLGFTLGFYAIDVEPLLVEDWGYLLLTPAEVIECWKLLNKM